MNELYFWKKSVKNWPKKLEKQPRYLGDRGSKQNAELNAEGAQALYPIHLTHCSDDVGARKMSEE